MYIKHARTEQVTTLMNPENGNLTNAESAAQDVMAKIPKDLHHLTIDSLLPMITVLMAHVQEFKDLNGPSKKQLVLYCLDLMIQKMPFPESQILAPIVKAVAPQAIEGIMQGSRYAERHGGELLKNRPRLPGVLTKISWPQTRLSRPKPSPPKSMHTPTDSKAFQRQTSSQPRGSFQLKAALAKHPVVVSRAQCVMF